MAATLTPKATEQLKAYIGRLLDEWEVPLDLRIALAAGGANVRTNVVTTLRDQLVRTLRDRCWQDNARNPANFLWGHLDPGRPWVPLSTPNIGALCSVTHGAVVRSLQRTAKSVDTVCV